MIKIARLIPFFSGQYGGPVKHILELTKNLSKYPIKTTVYASSEIDHSATKRTYHYQFINPNFIIKRFNSYIRFKDYRISFSLFPSIFKDCNNIDIFHSHAFRSFQEDVAALVSIIKKKKFVITTHGALCTNINYFHYLYKRIYDLADTTLKNKLLNINYIAVSKIEVEFLKRYGINIENIHYIPHGINTNHFKPHDPMQIISKYNLSRLLGKDIILYVGRIAKRKGIDILIKAFSTLKDDFPNAILLIVGGDYGYKNTIQKLAKKQKFSDKIVFLGFIPKLDLPGIYSLAKVVVYPSKFEIFGHVILEANACEKPVIASNHWGPKELIRDSQTGYLINYGNIFQLKEKIKKILENEDLRNQMGKNARNYVKKQFSWKKNANEHFKLYQKILNS
ncbi:MAG: glycosyltransferase family 4 protein [Promethearchaeota archaeon]